MLIASGSLTNKTFVLAGSAALSQVLYAGLVVVVASRSGPAEFGAAAVALGVGGFLVGLLDFGSASYAIRELSAGRMTQSEYWNRLRSKIAFGALGTCALIAFGLALSGPEVGGAIALVMVGRTLVTGVSVPQRAAQQVVRVAVVALVERAASVVTFVVLALSLPLAGLTAFWWSLGVGSAVAVAVGVTLTDGGTELWRRTTLTNPWSGVAGYGRFSLAVSASALDVVVLGVGGGSTQAALYGAVGRWTQPVLLLSQAFSSAAVPVIARARSSKAGFEAVKKSIWIPALGVVACVSIIALAPTAVPALLGAAYRESGTALAVLAGGAAVVVVNQPLAAFLQASGFDHFVGTCTVVTVVLQLGCTWLAADSLGAVGAALSYALSQVVLTVALALGGRNLLRRRRSAADREPAEPAMPETSGSPSATR